MGSHCANVLPAPGFTVWRRLFGAGVLMLIVGVMGGGCADMPHNSVATIGGEAEGARLDKAPEPERIEALTRELRMLSSRVDPREAADCAARAVRYSEELKKAYHITEPIELNNMMVNVGLKKRGLCYQLADDMQAEMKAQRYKTLVFQRATANWDDLVSEHNCVVVTAPGQDYKKGIVLDVWRNAGRLRWARVDKDHYPWVLREPGKAVIATGSSEEKKGASTGG